MDDSAHLLNDGRRRSSSHDDHQQAVQRRAKKKEKPRPSRRGKSLPSLTSPLATHFLLTVTTAVLATIGFIGALLAALSCEFVQVTLNDHDVPTSSSASAVTWIESDPTDRENWYYNELLEREADHTTSIGVFCPSSMLTQDAYNSRNTISKAFLATTLVSGVILLAITYLISTVLPNTERIWSGISLFAGIGVLCQLPVFLILDSPACTGDFTCALSGGSFGLFCSIACYLVLAFITQWREAPEWKEEYEIWKLRRQNDTDRAMGKEDVELGMIQEERSGVERDVEMGLPPNNAENYKVAEALNIELNSSIKPQEIQVNQTEVITDLPSPPPPPPDLNSNHNITPPNDLKQLAKEIRMHETSKFVGTYINIGNEPTTPDHKPTDGRNISPISMCTFSRDGSSAVSTGVTTEVHKNTKVPPEVLSTSMDLINQQLKQTLELKRNLIEKKRQQRCEQKKQFEEISQLSFLDYNGVDTNVKTFQQAPFGKDSFDHALYTNMPDLSSIIVSNDEEDVSRLNGPALEKSVDNLVTVTESANNSVKSSDKSMAESVRSSAKQVNESMKNIFRKATDKENKNNNRANKRKCKEMILEDWMLEGTSLGRSSSDDSLFLLKQNRDDGASSASRRSKVTMLSWASRCMSPDKRKGTKTKEVSIISPTGNGSMPPEITAAKHIGSCSVVTPEKDDPLVEMYPSDASMSTLSLPTAGYYTSEDDCRSKSSKHYARGFSSGTDDENEEMSIIIAGVQRMNRKTCGKPSHLSKKRRRRKKSSRCSVSEHSSLSGSLLDEVIDEEGPLNESGEPIPAIIDALPMKPVRRKKSKSPRKKSKSPRKSGAQNIQSDVESGYESGYASRSDNESRKEGYRMLSENEESTSSLAARARRNRLLSKRQVHAHPDPSPSDPPRDADDASGYKSPTNSHYSRKSSCDELKPQRSLPSCDYDIPPISKNSDTEGCFGSMSQRGNISWQARNSRMSRLRMQRQASAPESIVREPSVVGACDSDEASI